MPKKAILILLTSVLLLTLATVAMAGPRGYGRGGGPGGQGYCPAYGPGTNWGPAQTEETAKLRNDMYQKRLKMNELLAAETLDEEKIKGLQAEINQLRNQMADQRLESVLEFRKRNQDWRPGYGCGRGYHNGWNRGRGYGPGPRY